MFPILKTKKEIEEMKQKGLIEGKDFIIGCSHGDTKDLNFHKEHDHELEERWSIIFPGFLT